MIDIIEIIGISVITIASVVFLKQYKPEIALVVAGIGGVIVLSMVIADFSEIVDSLSDLFREFSVSSAVFSVVIKALGVCLISDFTSNTCRDFGQTALASGVEFAGKVVVIALSLPIITETVKAAVELIK